MSVDDAVTVTVEETTAFAAGEIQATEGGVVSGSAFVVVVALVDVAETRPRVSYAEMAYVYLVDAVRPVSR